MFELDEYVWQCRTDGQLTLADGETVTVKWGDTLWGEEDEDGIMFHSHRRVTLH